VTLPAPVDAVPWNAGNVQIAMATHCVPPEVPRADRPVSSVVFVEFPRREVLMGPSEDQFAYLGRESVIDVIVDGQLAAELSLDLQGE
jgi:hypothetical protein